MTVTDIINSVRWCIDEEAVNASNLSDVSAYDFDGVSTDIGLMNNIIKDKIGDALRWISLYAPSDMLGGTDEPDTTEQGQLVHHPTGILVDFVPTDIDEIEISETAVAGRFPLDEKFIKLARVRVAGWHRAVKEPIGEDSEEYYQLYDENGATATYDRPQAALIEKSVRELEVWPWKLGETIDVTYVSNVDPEDNAFDVVVVPGEHPVTERHYPLPPKSRTAFIYYLAFLLLSAYGDGRADKMLAIAKMNIGLVER